jgi:hypothetical protein
MRARFRAAGLAVLAGTLALLLVRTCADGGNMGARDQTCECLGREWLLYDARPADGPRRTICIGIIRSWTCYRMTGGPVVDCKSRGWG